ncbi:hypothetical protein HDU84_004911 [Entophlyctis sp. JEL0112]|nr:hypothetical protein HDU84_004911 [Entophlyctis sp. JEL0112]
MAQKKTLWSLYLILTLVFLNSCNNGYDGSMFGSVLNFEEFTSYFNLPSDGSGWLTGQLASIINVGNIVGGFITTWIVDFRGRRFALVIGSLIIIIGCIIQGTTTGNDQLIVGRFIVGVGLPITVSAAPIYVAEFSPRELRGTLVGLYNCFWFFGSFASRVTVSALVNYTGELKWRLPLFLQMTPSVIVVLTIFLLPESPRYMIMQGRTEEAAATLAKYHADGDVNADVVKTQVAEIQQAILDEAALRPDSVMSSIRGYVKLFTNMSSLYRLFLAWLIAWYPGISIISYYLTTMLDGAGITDTSTKLGIAVGLDVASFIAACLGSLFLVETLGRRRMAQIATFITVISMIIIGVCSRATQNDDGSAVSNKTATIFAVLAIYLANVGFAATWTPLQALYPTEIFSFSLRAKAAGITNVFWGTSGFLFNSVNPTGLQALHWKYYFVQFAWNFVWVLFVYFLMVETKGRSLEQLEKVFTSKNPVKMSLEPIEPEVAEPETKA